MCRQFQDPSQQTDNACMHCMCVCVKIYKCHIHILCSQHEVNKDTVINYKYKNIYTKIQPKVSSPETPKWKDEHIVTWGGGGGGGGGGGRRRGRNPCMHTPHTTMRMRSICAFAGVCVRFHEYVGVGVRGL